jgi:glutathione S-transferase
MSKLRVFVFSPAFGLPTLGPFALKLEVWLRMAGIEYERVFEDDTRKGPKGKNPWVEIDGERMGDTELIIERLSGERGVDLDGWLSSEQRALATAVTRMVEEHLHQVVEWELFVHEDGWRVTETHFDTIVPRLVGGMIKKMVRKQFARQLHARGLARHAPEVIAAMGRRDLEALEVFIGEGPYLFGDRPCTADAAVFGQIGVLSRVPADTPAMSYVRESEVLKRYCDGILREWFGDAAEELAMAG